MLDILYGFHRADWEDWALDETMDGEATFDAYTEALKRELLDAFAGPDSLKLTIDWDTATTGSLPHPLKPRVFEDGTERDDLLPFVEAAVERVNARHETWVVLKEDAC